MFRHLLQGRLVIEPNQMFAKHLLSYQEIQQTEDKAKLFREEFLQECKTLHNFAAGIESDITMRH